jgi:acetate kinase
MHEPILVINAGSSSIKFSVFETGADRSLSPAAHGEVEGIGTASRLSVFLGGCAQHNPPHQEQHRSDAVDPAGTTARAQPAGQG